MAAKPTVKQVLAELKRFENPESVKGMASVGINPENSYGVCMPRMMAIAKRIGTNHPLALELWKSGIRDARILASMVEDPELVTPRQMDSWARDLNSWDVCDSACMRVFCETKFARKKIAQWARDRREFVKRAGFSTLAFLTCHDKKADDKAFEKFFPLITRASTDDRNYVRKAVNWALRTIGKRSIRLNRSALKVARQLARSKSKPARWIGSDAVRELAGPAVQKRLLKQAPKKD